jgi:hypothetical protein
MPLRIGIVGARRSRQGIGEHVARHLAKLGASVTAIVGTCRETAEQARGQLQERYGLLVRAYTGLDEMLAGETLDAVAICSPQECHRQHLRQTLAAGVHVLCEKPLVFEVGRDPVVDARPLVEGFAAAGKVLMVNEQWPYTLLAFQQLFPRVDLQSPPRKLSMLLSPHAAGAEMVPNALPHALSLLFALAPAGGSVEGIRTANFARQVDSTAPAKVSFRYQHCGGSTEVSVTLRPAASPPRAAGYAIDGYAARRQIEMQDYRMFFEAASSDDCEMWHRGAAASNHVRRVRLEDPLQRLLAEFVDRCQQASHGTARAAEINKDATILERLAILYEVYQQARVHQQPCQHLQHASLAG